MIRQEELC